MKIIIYQSGSVVSDAEMVNSAKCIFFYVNVIVYLSWSVVLDAEMVHSALLNFCCEFNCILFLEFCAGCGMFFSQTPRGDPG